MRRNFVVARRYAQALLSSFQDDWEKAMHELRLFEKVLDTTPQGKEFFLSPLIPQHNKENALQDLKFFFPTTLSFFIMLIQVRRFCFLKEIIGEFENLCSRFSKKISVDLEIANEPSDALLRQIGHMLQEEWKQTIEMKTQINPDLLGGFVARGGGRILDVSLRGQLQALEKQVLL